MISRFNAMILLSPCRIVKSRFHCCTFAAKTDLKIRRQLKLHVNETLLALLHCATLKLASSICVLLKFQPGDLRSLLDDEIHQKPALRDIPGYAKRGKRIPEQDIFFPLICICDVFFFLFCFLSYCHCFFFFVFVVNLCKFKTRKKNISCNLARH